MNKVLDCGARFFYPFSTHLGQTLEDFCWCGCGVWVPQDGGGGTPSHRPTFLCDLHPPLPPDGVLQVSHHVHPANFRTLDSACPAVIMSMRNAQPCILLILLFQLFCYLVILCLAPIVHLAFQIGSVYVATPSQTWRVSEENNLQCCSLMGPYPRPETKGKADVTHMYTASTNVTWPNVMGERACERVASAVFTRCFWPPEGGLDLGERVHGIIVSAALTRRLWLPERGACWRHVQAVYRKHKWMNLFPTQQKIFCTWMHAQCN